MPKFKFTATKLENILTDYAQIREQTIPDAVVANARLLCVELARRTQPFGDDDKAKLKGEKAITRDLLGRSGSGAVRAGIFTGNTATAEQGFAYYATGPNVRLFISKSGFAYGTDKTFYKPDASKGELRNIHKSKFKNGKMSSAGARTRDVGRWKFIEKFIVNASTLDSYVDDQIKKVGWAKAAWAACARELRQVTGSATRGIPRWVTRHDSFYGDVVDNSYNLKNPSVKLTNSTPYASQVIPQNEIASAKAVVITKMIQQMKRILKYREKEIA